MTDELDSLSKALAYIERQRQDIRQLTYACQVLFRRNKELEDELRRSQAFSPVMDERH
jgi:hypothetical protein